MLSDIIVNRQRAARCCQDALRSSKTKEEVYHVLRLMVRLSDDVEPSVRVELMEQVPHVAVYCYEHHSMMEAVPQYILFIVLRFLTDSNNQVRKTSQAALLVLLEQEVVEREDIEEQVCPVLLQLTGGESNDDYRSEAVALMSKMAPLVGQDITERYFLPRFKALCSDPLFHVRKVCASSFDEMCSVPGPDVTSEQMQAPRAPRRVREKKPLLAGYPFQDLKNGYKKPKQHMKLWLGWCDDKRVEQAVI